MDVGFIGLGRMGEAMAGNLLKAGHRVTVYNRTAEKAAPLVRDGATLARSIREAARARTVITMLANDDAVEETVFGADGIIAHLPKLGLHIACSTMSVALSERLTEAHAKAGQRFVAAPVFGRPDAAAAKRLVVVAAGEDDAVKIATPLFEAMGPKLFVVSEVPKNANLVKLGGNFLIMTVIESLGEAFALVAKAGIERQRFLDILTSTLFDAPVYKTYGGLIAKGDFSNPGFAASLGLKDARLVLAAAEELGVPLPLANLVRDRFLNLLAHDGGDLDWSAIGRLPSDDAGCD